MLRIVSFKKQNIVDRSSTFIINITVPYSGRVTCECTTSDQSQYLSQLPFLRDVYDLQSPKDVHIHVQKLNKIISIPKSVPECNCLFHLKCGTKMV